MQHSREAYEYRYVNNPYGLVGDVESEKAWHQHFRDEEMRDLMTRNGFAVEENDAAGLFSTVFDVISALTPFGRLFTQKLRNWDSYTFAGRMLFCRATKPEA